MNEVEVDAAPIDVGSEIEKTVADVNAVSDDKHKIVNEQ